MVQSLKISSYLTSECLYFFSLVKLAGEPGSVWFCPPPKCSSPAGSSSRSTGKPKHRDLDWFGIVQVQNVPAQLGPLADVYCRYTQDRGKTVIYLSCYLLLTNA